MGKFLTIAVLGVATAFPAFAEDPGWSWVSVSKDGNEEYSIKLESGEKGRNQKDESMTVVVGRVKSKEEGEIDLYKWYVTDAHCAQEYGHLVILNLDGSWKFDANYAKGSKSVGSSIAETICSLSEYLTREAAGKSI